MKRIRGFMLYILIIGLVLISTIVLVLIKNSSLNRNIENFQIMDYKRYLLTYKDLLKSVDDERDKWISFYNEKFLGRYYNYNLNLFKDFGNELKIIGFKNYCFHININYKDKNGINSFSEGTVLYLPISIVEAKSCVNIIENKDIPLEFLNKVKTGEKLKFTIDKFLYKEFSNSKYEIVIDDGSILIKDINDEEKIEKLKNDKYLYLNFINSKIKITSKENSQFYGILQTNDELYLQGQFNLSGTLISGGTIINDKIISKGMILYKDISDINLIDSKEKNIRQLDTIDDLITLDITSFI